MTVLFNEGDKVRYVGSKSYPNSGWIGCEGVVEKVLTGTDNIKVRLTKVTDYVRNEHWWTHTEGDTVNLSHTKLELLPEEVKFGYADIRVGDVIRRTYATGGFTEIREGKVISKDAYHCRADLGEAGELAIAYKSNDGDDKYKLELVSRKETHWSEEIEVGAVGYGDSASMPKIFYKTGENTWKVTYLEDNTVYDFDSVEDFKDGYGQITSKDQINWVSK